MKPAAREAAAALAPAALMAALLGALAAMLGATLAPAEHAAAWALLQPRLALVLLLWLLASLAAGLALRRAWLRFGVAPARLAEDLQVRLAGEAARPLSVDGSAGIRALAAAINGLLQQRDALRADMATQVAEASRATLRQHQRLDALMGALMAELTQSVVVCNLDGRILLFNARARLQFRALAASAGGAAGGPIGGAEAVGLGRSIYALLDRQLVAHALALVQVRLQRGAAHPSAQFVTATRGGQLLRVQMAPVRVSEAGAVPPLDGFVLMLDRLPGESAEDSGRDHLWRELTETQRSALGQLQAAVAQLVDPAVGAAARERTLAEMRETIAAMARRVNEAAAQDLQALKTRWPLEDMLGADLVAAASRRIETLLGARVTASEVDGALWLRLDGSLLIQALLHLSGRLADEYGVQHLRLRLAADGEQARLDLAWAVQAMSTETVSAWETEPMRVAGETSPLSVRDVVERHGGRLWFERARAQQEAFFRLLLPRSAAAPLEAAAVAREGSRPEFYDFDLFAQGEPDRALADRALTDLGYTVFDTETTGLAPAAGDEIVQIGAVRIVAGKLRRGETFEQLVDPRRPLPPANVAIHGIEPEMLRGQPGIEVVLPAFHAFAQDSVLVAHNAAFDMRFLQLKEQACGVRFEQPVLDTLLLSALVHPQQPSHRLEAIAERLGVPVLGRHTALGDAMVTAEVFLGLLPLLRALGIVTLGQALEASRKTQLARLKY